MNKVEQPQPRSAKAFSQGEQRAVMNAARNALPETDIEFGIAALATHENVLSPRLELPPTYGDSQGEAITAIFTSMTEQVGHAPGNRCAVGFLRCVSGKGGSDTRASQSS